MSKIVSVLALLIAVGSFLHSHAEIAYLKATLEQNELDMVSLQRDIERGETAMALLRKFTMVNHERIKNLQRKRVVTVTAYSPREAETDSTPFLTATNKRVRAGIVAVSRDLFDQGWVFGRKVYIKNHGVFIIDDLMAKHKRRQIDIFMYDTKQALVFGRKKLEAYLLDT